MDYAIRVTAADKITVQETGDTLLSVQFDILKDGAAVATMRHGFALDTAPEALTAELETVLAAYVQDQETAASKAAFSQADAQADATIADIVGKEITTNA